MPPFGIERDGEPILRAETWKLWHTGLSIPVLPLTFPHPETGAAVALHLSLPNPYTHREAARYAGHTWVSFCALVPTARRDALAHYMVHRLVEVHTADATATRQEEQARAQQAAAEAKRHG